MKVADFDFNLPEDRIAQQPVEPRDSSRLMVVPKGQTNVEHHVFHEILDFLTDQDVLVINDTRVIPARLFGQRMDSGGKVEFLLLRPMGGDRWEVLVKPGRRARLGVTIDFGGKLQAHVGESTEVGGRIVEFSYQGKFEEVLEELGETPLPPYIVEKLEDKERYQTVYSRDAGSVAAPTAGLHFTPALLDAISAKGVTIVPLTLHVGLGTFRPVQAENVEEHVMHGEYYRLSEESAQLINRRKAQGGRVIAVGTTSVRTLETLTCPAGIIQSGAGWTHIFIYPGYQFKMVDGLITNFHLPRSSLLMLVAAFTGQESMEHAYQTAIREHYRFYSFGDAMFII